LSSDVVSGDHGSFDLGMTHFFERHANGNSKFATLERAASLASDADDMMCLIMEDNVRMAPLLNSSWSWFVR
jgi:hypothetical protein